MAHKLWKLANTTNAPIFGIDINGNMNEWNFKTMEITSLPGLKDTVIVLDNANNVIGSKSKRGLYKFIAKQQQGVLHCVFSVFIFDLSTGELLLQKRASTKITSLNAWTNICCSHPLHGMSPNEVDRPEDGSVMAVYCNFFPTTAISGDKVQALCTKLCLTGNCRK
eukprot:6945618-Ditylum_brightwellii.AAC.1